MTRWTRRRRQGVDVGDGGDREVGAGAAVTVVGVPMRATRAVWRTQQHCAYRVAVFFCNACDCNASHNDGH